MTFNTPKRFISLTLKRRWVVNTQYWCRAVEGMPPSNDKRYKSTRQHAHQIHRTWLSELKSCTTQELVTNLKVVLEDDKLRKEILSAKGDDAQRWLDLLHKPLDSQEDSATISTPFRSTILKTITRLIENSGLFPQSLILQNVHMDGKYPVAGGAFGDVWRGRIGESDASQTVCVKAVRMYQNLDVKPLFKEYLREAVVWKQLHHSNVLPFLGVHFLDGSVQRICLVSPWMDHGNLVQYLKLKKEK
ncbi:hypothetical protein PQX77_007954, partial [Marasmius sp. AFHP31]